MLAKYLIPKKEKILSPQDYLREISVTQNNIDRVEFIPPRIGSRDYGSFRIRYKIPVLAEE